jgi:hypothetical protein
MASATRGRHGRGEGFWGSEHTKSRRPGHTFRCAAVFHVLITPHAPRRGELHMGAIGRRCAQLASWSPGCCYRGLIVYSRALITVG